MGRPQEFMEVMEGIMYVGNHPHLEKKTIFMFRSSVT